MQNLFSFEGKRCLLTGCFSGMGEASAQIIQSLGGSIVAVDIKRPTTYEFEAFHEVDLRDPAAIEEMVNAVKAEGPIDRVFYCAGLPGTFPALDVMGVNFVGLRHLLEQVVPHMPSNGAFASISSAAGMGWQGLMEQTMALFQTSSHADAMKWVEENQGEGWLEPYSFSKACTIAYTLWRGPTLTSEYGVRVNCIAPGPTDTPMMPAFVEQAGAKFMEAYPRPIGRNSTAEEQGWAMAYLNSDAASYVSGEVLYTDGGAAAGMMTGSVTLDASALGQ